MPYEELGKWRRLDNPEAEPKVHSMFCMVQTWPWPYGASQIVRHSVILCTTNGRKTSGWSHIGELLWHRAAPLAQCPPERKPSCGMARQKKCVCVWTSALTIGASSHCVLQWEARSRRTARCKAQVVLGHRDPRGWWEKRQTLEGQVFKSSQ